VRAPAPSLWRLLARRAVRRQRRHELAAGDAGYILTSIDHRTAYLQPGDGRSLTNDWRAVDLASPSRGAVGGLDGMLLLSDRLNTVPDVVAPTGDVQGPTRSTTSPSRLTCWSACPRSPSSS
jgi:hypothetical protein